MGKEEEKKPKSIKPDGIGHYEGKAPFGDEGVKPSDKSDRTRSIWERMRDFLRGGKHTKR